MENNLTNLTADAVQKMTLSVGIITLSGLFCITCLWIILINGFLIVCFWLNRGEPWCSQSKNILSIIIIDILDGLSTLVWFFISFIAGIDRNVCLTSVGLSMASHSAAALNILRVCVTRLPYIRITPQRNEQPTSRVILQTVSIWLVASVLVLVPLEFWTVKQPVLDGCRWTSMFSTNEAYVNRYMLFVITLPTLGTSVLYGMLVRKLRRLNNLAKHMAPPSTAGERRHGGISNQPDSSHKQSLRAMTKSVSDIAKGPGRAKDETAKREIVSIHEKRSGGKVIWEKSTSGHTTSITSNKDSPTYITANEVTDSASLPCVMKNKRHDNGLSTSGSVMKPHKRDVTRSGLNHKEPGTGHTNVRVNKVIKILGIALVLINISNLPFTVFLFLKTINPEMEISGTLAALSLFFLMLSSACNVFVYAVQLQPMRLAVLQTLRQARGGIAKIFCSRTRVYPA